MDWFPCRTTAFLIILMVFLDISAGFHVEVKEWNENNVTRWKTFKRQKREWIEFAAACREGEDNSKRNPIAKIRSDCEENQPIVYSISGIGIDQPPYGIFVINKNTGEINITSIVDREVTPMFVIRCYARHAITNREVEPPLDLRIRVLDINDNAPVFSQATYMGSIEESSMETTLVMKLIATDADEPNNLNSKIAYKIVSQEPAGASMFILNRDSGEVHIANYLDREQYDRYSLVVRASDRDGAADGISSQCTCSIEVIDVNDNFPTLLQNSYSASIEENTLSSQLLMIQVVDRDQMFSDNWAAEFFFLSGNEDNFFEFVTDTTNNVGILKVIKPLNYEQMQSLQLSFAVRNKAAFHHSIASQYQVIGTPLTIQVINVKEPPSFQPSTRIFYIPRDLSKEAMSNYIVGMCAATDEETGLIASNVRYLMGYDPASMFKINAKTGELRLNKFDWSMLNVGKGFYKAEILAITEGIPANTATGTVVITIQDDNDNCPVLSTDIRKICMSAPSTVLSAKDLYSEPYEPPFTFIIVDQPPKGSWTLRPIDDLSAELTAQKMEFLIYDIDVYVIDSQGRRCERPQRIPLQACVCDDRQTCTTGATEKAPIESSTISGGVTPRENGFITTDPTIYTAVSTGVYVGDSTPGRWSGRGGTTTLGGGAIALMFLGALIFLLVPILMAMSACCDRCGYKARPVGGVGAGFEPVPECDGGAIHSWGIEGAHPQDQDVTSISVTKHAGSAGEIVESSGIYTNTRGGTAINTGMKETSGLETAVDYGRFPIYGTTSGYRKESVGGTLQEYREGGVNMAFLDSYFAEKAFAYADEDEGRPANDCLLIYDHEGIGSPVGSIGCCSFIGEDMDDTYLDTLGPKFKTLAEICLGKVVEPIPGVSATFPNIDSDLKLPPPGTTIIVNESSSMPPQVGSTTFVTENTYASGATLQPARPIPDPLLHGNVMVTETYTSGSTFQPPALTIDPLRASNVVVTERVLAPNSDLRGVLNIPDLTDGANVVVTERVIAPGSRLPPSLSIPDLADGSNVVVTERVIRPASGLQGSLNIPSELSNAHNVVVTERVLSGPGVSGMGGMSSMTGQMLSADSHFNQTFGSASPGTSRRRVTKYSTIQYANQ
ncbi:desmoglein-1 [Pelodiscus sinensis]|uniref:desmoglein-1 n=1 Tax=Pelodiscus sinensis TaxID=13735 RepID=UPI003F6A8DC5